MYTDKILNTAYSFAAAIVIFGAWAKIEHQDFGGPALTVGLLVESGIFIIYGFMEWGRQQRPSEDVSPGQIEIDELKQTVEKTNTILKKIFRASEN